MPDPRPLAVVTGASAGIGRAFAQALARDGYDLLVVARRRERLDQTAAEARPCGAAAEVLAVDLAADGGPAQVVARARDLGGCALFVNNAGAGLLGRFAEQDPARIAAMLRLNVVAHTELLRAFVGDMVAAGTGAVINVASTAAYQPTPAFAAYAASKAFVLSLSEALATELAGSGVHVMALCPGGTQTEFLDAAGFKTAPFQRVYMRAEDVVAAALRGLKLRKTVVVPGAVNKATAVGARILPRAATKRIAAWIFRGAGSGRVGGPGEGPER